jgi:hypothetical protein
VFKLLVTYVELSTIHFRLIYGFDNYPDIRRDDSYNIQQKGGGQGWRAILQGIAERGCEEGLGRRGNFLLLMPIVLQKSRSTPANCRQTNAHAKTVACLLKAKFPFALNRDNSIL